MTELVDARSVPQLRVPGRSGDRIQRVRRIALPAVALGMAIVLAACSSSATPAPTPAPATPAPTAAGAAATPAAPPAIATAVKLTAATGGPKGSFLADDKGMALYTYAKDTGATSTCEGGCAKAWPPLLVKDASSVTEGDGVTGKVGVSARSDGTMQVTFNGVPIYYYAKDAKPGDTTGEGVGGVWFLIAPGGAAAATPPAASAATGGAATVMLAAGATPFLTDAKGMTLYTYDKDSGSTSTCTGGCATAWPPLLKADGATLTAGPGVTGKLDDSKRPEGTDQVTYNGKPVYFFASDSKPGDTTGDGVGGVWHLVKP